MAGSKNTGKAANQPSDRERGDRYGEAFWAGMRDEYATGEESLAKLAQRFNVSYKLAERHSGRAARGNGGKSWGEWRAEFNDDVARKAIEISTETAARNLAKVRELSADVSRLALEALQKRLTAGVTIKRNDEGQFETVEIDDKNLIAAAKIAMTVKIEIGGDPNAPLVSIQKKLDELTPEQLAKIASTGHMP